MEAASLHTESKTVNSQAEGASTLLQIHAAAKEEFMNKGFLSASLRSIVKAAGVTTGAFYGYYNSKEELFGALVGEAYTHIMTVYKAALHRFASLPEEEQPEYMGKISQTCMQEMLHYMLEHSETFHLLLECAEGTRYAFMVDEIVELEIAATRQYYKVLEALGHKPPQVDKRLEHILITGMMNAYFEIVIHDMPPEDAQKYVEELHDFYTAGWHKLMGEAEA